ncbi:hypothetical protein, conserved [Babesia ovata]|uniref:Uncharacterized protein n=1 Tax=Babesia ovata TaxID=189622 RepID=A0A2H6KFB8_9APIC|nr:uncharacterized protein BOVATA_031750 [Babesia ovata]GBE61682.1 hypothetical protein, conserved [Babesia ovata]
MVYTSLTEVPRNLKEGVDWLIALKGTDAKNNLKAMGAALFNFLAGTPVGYTEVPALENIKLITKEFMEIPALKYLWPARAMLRKFNDPKYKECGVLARWFADVQKSDYTNVVDAGHLTAEPMAENLGKVVDGCERFLESIKIPDQYKSAYSPEATWEASCAKDPEACAVILVGIAPMLYTGLRSLNVASEAESYRRQIWLQSPISLTDVVKAVGYKDPGCRDDLSDSDILKALKGVSYQTLVTLYDLSGFWAFYGLDKAGAKRAAAALSGSSANGQK